MGKKDNKYQNKLRPYISRDDKMMLREKKETNKRYRRVSDYHVDAL